MPENLTPQRVVSLQPSVTVTLRDLALLERLVACTKYCVDVCPEVRQIGCIIVEDSWSAKADQIMAAKPDLVIASVPYRLESVAEIMKCGVPFLGLAPKTLDDIYKDIMMITGLLCLPRRGEDHPGATLVAKMEKEVQAMWQRTMGLARPLVYCEEWGKPLILSQTWVAELVEAAGGRFFGRPGKQTTEEEIIAADPDVIVAAWCGAGDRVPLEKIIPKRGWEHTKAAKNGRVYCINDEFLNTPASTLIQGLHALAAAIHPEIFARPDELRQIRSEPVPHK
ncbi:MAG: ABC transporter substrate-binding protein [Acidobacteriia bacterium]|nr:ABC transporter substrate-binding protein [Terriglobia bacterium]